MSQNGDNPHRLAFSSSCVPGSEAELKEKERLETFQRNKALRLAAEESGRPEELARRQQAYETADEANRATMRRNKAARQNYGSAVMPRPSLASEMNEGQ